ncbi:dihydrodipicolinate synthase family protein [Pelosinus sp. Bkl1]|uniref:Dihydrodipicolinate synthase family protein n=1 Tax=Pelosinus baikalensis TaxID=2892015 RepID=A0ABS8HUV9_9FIRM|nr:dihydrodipicolinate synthase family protein [Pelosinus baikalensis]
MAPKLVVQIYDTFMAGDIQGSLEAQYKLAPLRVAMGLGSWPVVTKDAMNLIGFQAGEPIKPNTSCSEVNMTKLKNILANMGLLK